jgi:quercetin dioxygenase-like cupin family protein
VHAVDGPVTVQCIEGEVELAMNEGHQILHTGDLPIWPPVPRMHSQHSRTHRYS